MLSLERLLGRQDYLVVPLQEIQLAEDSRAMDAGGHMSHVGQGVAVGFGDHIKTMVILQGLQVTTMDSRGRDVVFFVNNF